MSAKKKKSPDVKFLDAAAKVEQGYVATGSRKGRVTFECVVCKHKWQSVDRETERHVQTAIKVNKAGPYCHLCMHFEMALRHAQNRGHKDLIEPMCNWLIYRKWE